ncbi:MAG: hypothetical protein AB8B91_15525 [Rubripirellula sp.]
MSQVLEPTQTEADLYQQPGKNNNCLIFGCLGAFVGVVVLFVCSGLMAYRFAVAQVDKYTATEPMELPSVEYEPEQIKELEARIEAFQDSLKSRTEAGPTPPTAPEEIDADAGSEPESEEAASQPEPPAPETETLTELVLTADDINALLSKEKQFRNRVFVKIEDGQITGDLSMPLDDLSPTMKGRFLNGSATFQVTLEDSMLFITLQDAEVKGEQIPEAIMTEIRNENLAKDLNNDRKHREVIRQFESVRVEGDKIIARLKQADETDEDDSKGDVLKVEAAPSEPQEAAAAE